MKHLSMILTVLMLGGCSLIPTERSSLIQQQQRESIAANTTANVVTAAKVNPPEVTITTTAKDGSKIEVKQPAQVTEQTDARTGAHEDSNSEASGTNKNSVSIPMFVKIIGSAIGLFMLLIIFWLIKRSSSAVNAAWTWVDSAIANKIQTTRTLASTTTEPGAIAAYKTMEAELENLRAETNK